MDVQLRSRLVESLQREIRSPLEYFRPLGLEIVVNRIPKHFDSQRIRQPRIVELNLHVDDVRHPRPRHLRHVLRVPDSAPDRDPAGHPTHIHAAHSVTTRLASRFPHKPRGGKLLRDSPTRWPAVRHQRPMIPFHSTASLPLPGSAGKTFVTPGPACIPNCPNSAVASPPSSPPSASSPAGNSPTSSNRNFIAA